MDEGEASPSQGNEAGRSSRYAARSDWRFLLANPEVGRVGYVGRRAARLLEALRQLGPRVDLLDAADTESGGDDATRTYDLIIAHDPSEPELRLAAERVAPGGALVVEARGPAGALGFVATDEISRGGRRHLHSPGSLVRHVSALGFENVRAYWHWPSFDRCTRIIPLEDRMAIRHALSRAGSGRADQIFAWLGRGLLRLGWLGWAVASLSVIGRRARKPLSCSKSRENRQYADIQGSLEPAVQTQTVVHAFLDNKRWNRLDLDRYSTSRRLSFVVLTPRFKTSTHLIFLLIPEGELEPALVAKVPRFQGHCATTKREAERLHQIQTRRPGGFDSIPRLVGFEPFAGRTILIETAMRGRAMDQAMVRKHAPQCCEGTLSWLIDVQTATRLAPDPGGHEILDLIERDLVELQATFPAEKSLLDRTRELVALLSSANIPLVLEHGDLSHPNVMVGPRGAVSVIDWELAELRGLPASDLFFFLAYVARAIRRTRSETETLAAMDQAFFMRGSWTRPYVGRYADALGLPKEILGPLFVASWVRQVAGLVRRVGNGEGCHQLPTDKGAGALGDWRLGVWRRAVEQADRLGWDRMP